MNTESGIFRSRLNIRIKEVILKAAARNIVIKKRKKLYCGQEGREQAENEDNTRGLTQV